VQLALGQLGEVVDEELSREIDKIHRELKSR